MLRFNMLAVLCLGVLSSCTPSEPGETAPVGSLAQKASALTVEVTVPFEGERAKGKDCLKCREVWDYECVENTTNTTKYLEKPFQNPAPSSALVVGVTATVYGRLLDTTDSDGKELISVMLNSEQIGTNREFAERACNPSDTNCDSEHGQMGWSVSELDHNNGIPHFNHKGGNQLKIGVSQPDNFLGSRKATYCVSHVKLSFSYQERNLSVTIPSDGRLRFGNRKIGTSKTLSVEVTNTGGATIRQITPAIQGTGFALSNSSAFDLPAGGIKTLQVEFHPTGPDESVGKLTFTSNDEFYADNPSAEVSLSGTGVDFMADVDPSSLDFGEQPVSSTSEAKPVTILTVGALDSEFNVLDARIEDSQAFAVAPSPNAGFPLPVTPSTPQTINVTFSPLITDGETEGTLTIETDDQQRPLITIPLRGIGVRPILTVDANPKNFGEQRVNADSEVILVSVKNDGDTGTLRLTNIAVSGSDAGAFSVSPNSLELAPDESKDITVTFTPQSEGTFNANLTFNSNGVGADPLTTIPLTGTGVRPILSVDDSPKDFGEQRVNFDSKELTVPVSNSGTSGTLLLSNIIVSGPDADAFSVSPDSLNVAPGKSGDITVTFAPKSEGTFSATLSFDSNQVGGTPVTIPLTGTGMLPLLSVDSSHREFGEQRATVDSEVRQVSVSNAGSGTLQLSNITVSGLGAEAFSVNPSSLDVPEGGDKDITVTFAPQSEGTFNANLTFSTNEVGAAPVSIPLSGVGIRPLLSVDNSLRSFGEQRVNVDSKELTVSVSNTGTSGTLLLSNITVSGASATVFSVSPGSLNVAPGASKNITVTFAPTSEGTFNANLTFSSNGVGASALTTIPLSGVGIRPILSVDTSPKDFGEQRVNADSEVVQVAVSNTGTTGTLRLTNIAVSGSGAAAFSVSPSTLNVAPGEGKSIAVTFAPQSEGAFSATLSFDSNEVNGTSITIPLSGTGVRPILSVNASPKNFGEQRANADTTMELVAVSNTGTTGTLLLTNIAVTGTDAAAFSVSPGSLDMAAGEGKNIAVTFAPQREGAFNATLTFDSNEVGAAPVSIPLSGIGVHPILSVDNKPLDFGRQAVSITSQPRTVAVTNTGTGTLSLSNIGVSGTDADTFSATPSTLDVPEGDSRTISVRFTPSGERTFNAHLTFDSNQVGGTPVSISLTGTGVASAADVIPEGTLDFGPQRVNTTSDPKTLTVRNSGSTPLQVDSITIQAGKPFSVDPSNGFSLQPGETKDVQVRFTPTLAGGINGEITFSTSDELRPTITRVLSGTGVRSIVELSKTFLNFDDQQIHVPSAPQRLTVRNISAASASLNVSVASLTGPFSLTDSSSFVLEPGAERDLAVVFTPVSQDTFSGILTLSTNDPDRPTVTVNIAGRGVRPELTFEPASLAFGPQRVGSPSAPQRVTVHNNGTGVLELNPPEISASSPFHVTPSTAFSVLEGQSQELLVTFHPTASHQGAQTGTLTLRSNDVANPTATVYLSGTGVTLLDTDPATSATAQGVLDFGTVRVNTPQPINITLTNNSAVDVNLTGVAVEAPYSVNTEELNVSAPLKPGESRTFQVSFRPTGKTTFSRTLTLQSNAFNSPHVWTLEGRGDVSNAVLSVYPPGASQPEETNIVDFGGVRETTSAQRKVRLTNTGGVGLNIHGTPTITGDAEAFSLLTSLTAQTIPANSSIEFFVSYSPQDRIASSGLLTITSNAENSPSQLSLSGTGTYSEVTLSRSSIFFGDVRVGDKSFEVPITISNTGTAPVTIQSLPVTGPFEVIETSEFQLPQRIEPNGGTGIVKVRYVPSKAEVETGSVTITSDANVNPELEVSLEGRGTIAVVELSPNPTLGEKLEFGEQRVNITSPSQPIRISNVGSATLEVRGFSFSRSEFTLVSPTTDELPLKIEKSGQKEVYVTFTPKAMGDVLGKLTVVTDAFATPPALELTGSGVDGRMTLNPSVIEFQPVAVGSASGAQMQVTLKNEGNYPLKITDVVLPSEGAFTVSGLNKDMNLGSGQTLPFFVTFKPAQRGFASSTLVIRSDAALNSELSLVMSGRGEAPQIGLPSSTTIYFGDTNVGTNISQNIAIQNEGEGVLSVYAIEFRKSADAADHTSDFSTPASFPLLIESNQSTSIPVVFSPKATGERKAVIAFYTNDLSKQGTEPTRLLQGSGTAPKLVLSETILDFKSVPVGSASAALPIKLINEGSGPLKVESVELSGADAASFMLTPLVEGSFEIPRESSADFSVTFQPDSKRRFTALLTIKSNDAAGAKSIILSGQGDNQIQLSATILDFGQQLINHPSRVREVLITNNSGENIILSSLSVVGEGGTQFTTTELTSPIAVGPGASQPVSVSFTPLNETKVNSTLRLTFSVPSVDLEVGLVGQGIPSVLSVDKATLDFGTVRAGGPARTELLTITNRSSDEITLEAPEEIASKGVRFNYDGASLAGKPIGPGKSTTLAVTYAPQEETLSETTLGLGTRSPQKPRGATVELRGRATVKVLEVNPERLDFGRVDVGSPTVPKEFTITNKSTQNQRVLVSLQSPEDASFLVDAEALEAPIPPGESVTITVAFNPLDASPVSNEILLRLQEDNAPEVRIPVTGQGRSLVGQGGGCACSSTEAGSAGVLMLLTLVALGSRRRRHP